MVPCKGTVKRFYLNGHATQEKSQISFCKILKNKWYHAKVLLKRFQLNGHTIGFRQQTQKLELNFMSPLLTLGVKVAVINGNLTVILPVFDKQLTTATCCLMSKLLHEFEISLRKISFILLSGYEHSN